MRAEYLRSNKSIHDFARGYANDDKDGWIAGIDYSTLSRSKPGTFALRAAYYDVAATNTINVKPELDPAGSTPNGGIGGQYDGFKGYQLGGSYMLAKNIMLAVDWWDLEGQKNNYDQSLLWTQLYFYF